MKALLVQINGQRVRLAGSDSADWGVLTIIHYDQEGDTWSTRIDPIVADRSRQEYGSWPELEFMPGDVISLQIIDADQADAYAVRVPMPVDFDQDPSGPAARLHARADRAPERPIRALRVTRNGQQVCLAGAAGTHYLAHFALDYGLMNGQLVHMLDAGVLDFTRCEAGAWAPVYLDVGDVITVELVETAVVDDYEFRFEIPSDTMNEEIGG